MRAPPDHHPLALLALLSLPVVPGCNGEAEKSIAPRLSVEQLQPAGSSDLASASAKIGVVAPTVPIYAEPRAGARILGTLVAGSRVPRSESPVAREGCPGGFYAIEPRGYLCLDGATTLDEKHPILHARSMAANTKASLPYPYAKTRRDTTLYELDPVRGDGVRVKRRLAKGSFFAVVGSFRTLDDYDQPQQLALLTTGRFVSVRDLEPVSYPPSPMVALKGTTHRLPLALESKSTGAPINLTGRSKLVDGRRCWTTETDRCLAESEAFILRPRERLPEFASQQYHWAELDLSQSALLLYEGKLPVWATLVVRSPSKPPPSGLSYLRRKLVTAQSGETKTPGSGERLDLAWVLELDNGLCLRATTALGDYGERHDENAVELHPDDAHRVFEWLEPSIPAAWHGVTVLEAKRESSPIVLR